MLEIVLGAICQEKAYQRHIGFIKNSGMNIISFELSVCSQNVALLEEVRRITCSNADIHKGNETSKVCALQTKSSGYDTDAMDHQNNRVE